MTPTRLGPYSITATLGRGGMGTVFEAVDETTGRAVAVKTLATHLGDDPGLRKRFAAEIETLKSLRHAGIVELLAFGEEEGMPYFAMELVRGRSLEQLLRSGRRFTWQETVDTAIEVARALKSAHDHGVIHRDLKPANLIVFDAPPGDGHVKLADFGIAKLFGGSGHTMAGMIVGTAEYMAPEQAAGLPVDHRADLYALGLVMFAMLTGRPPFHGGLATDVIRRQRHEPAPRVASRVEGVPPELDDLVARLLAKDPAERPASALAVGRTLAAIAAAQPDTEASEAGETRATSRPDVDLLAPTRAFTAGGSLPGDAAILAGAATGRDVTPDGQTMPMPTRAPADTGLAHLPTEPAAGRGPGASSRANRFTTVEELARAEAAVAAARRRRDTRIQTVVAALLAAAVAIGGYLLLRAPTADELHARIMAAVSGPEADPRDARPLIDRFLAEHPGDPRAAVIRDLDRSLDLDTLEKRARRRRLGSGEMPPLEREYRAAMARESESAVACVAELDAILAVHADVATPSERPSEPEADPSLWMALIRRQIERLTPRAEQERSEDRSKAAATLAEAADLASRASVAADRADRDLLLQRRRSLLEAMLELYADRPHVAEAVAEARSLLSSP